MDMEGRTSNVSGTATGSLKLFQFNVEKWHIKRGNETVAHVAVKFRAVAYQWGNEMPDKDKSRKKKSPMNTSQSVTLWCSSNQGCMAHVRFHHEGAPVTFTSGLLCLYKRKVVMYSNKENLTTPSVVSPTAETHW